MDRGSADEIGSWDAQPIADFFYQKHDVDVALTYNNWNHISRAQVEQAHKQVIVFGKSNIPYSDERAGTTKVVKTAIKFILKNKKAVLKEVEVIGGNKAKTAVSKVFSVVIPKLKNF